jgi:ABC-type uncharacterized transport system permease subunit
MPFTNAVGIRLLLATSLHLARLTRQVTYAYRAGLFFSVFSILLQIYLLKVVWTALYAGHQSINALQLQTLIATLTLANLQIWLMRPYIQGYLYQRVRQGKIALDLARPVGLMSQLLAQQCGLTVALFPFVALAFPAAVLVGGLQPPASPGAAVLYGISLILAYSISVLIGLLIGLVAFWTLELAGFLSIYYFVNQFLSGALVPLQFFPANLRAVASVLPFQAQAYLPLTLYLGQARGMRAVGTLTLQLFWVLALYALARVVWRAALRHVVIQGG